MEKIQIYSTDIFLDDHGNGKGKITISDSEWDYNFSHYWGAMGEPLKEFLKGIGTEYFVMKLAGHLNGDFDAKGTFRNIRKYIREEMSYELPWYAHMKFQKEMRAELRRWQSTCIDERQFVDDWSHFWDYTIDYYLIEDSFDREEVEGLFKGICEYWNFIETKAPKEHIWLEKLHKKLKRKLK